MKFFFHAIILFISLDVSAQQKTLDYFLQSAIKNSPLIVENKNQAESLKYDSMLVRALYKPQVNFNGRGIYDPTINGYGYDRIVTNGGEFDALAGVNVNLVGRQNLNNQFQNILLQGQALKISGKLSERDLKQNITSLYLAVYGEQELLRNSEQVLNVLQKEDAVLKKLAEQGVYRETDYLSFFVNYRQQALANEQRKLQIKNDLATMNYISGISDTSYFDLEKPNFGTINILQPEQTLTFRQFQIDSMILKNNYDQVKFGYKPHFNLFGDVGYMSSLAYQAERNFGMSAGFSLAFPIYDGKQRYLRYEKIKLSESTRAYYMSFYKNQYSQKLLQLQQQINSTGQLITDAQNQLNLSDALVLANQKLLTTGDVKMADYVLALTNYISAQSTVLQLRINQMQLQNEFNYLNY